MLTIDLSEENRFRLTWTANGDRAKGKFTWPSAKDGVVALTSSQLACLLDGIDWRNPQYSWRPQSAG